MAKKEKVSRRGFIKKGGVGSVAVAVSAAASEVAGTVAPEGINGRPGDCHRRPVMVTR